jgi:predicted enzyme related to lactoylglutathione lyase
MRYTILAMSLAAALGAGELHAAHHNAHEIDVGSGRLAWFDITTPNLPVSKEFYSKLLDWHFMPVKGAGADQAAEIVAGDTSIGTLRVADGKISPFNGIVYVQVADIQASCAKAKELGGTIPPGFPFNLPDGKGSIALIVDPAGHPVGLYSKTMLPAKAAPAPAAK